MKFLFLVIILHVFSNSFSQNIIEAFEGVLNNTVGNAHLNMKNLNLKLDIVLDKDKLIALIYSPSENAGSIDNGCILIKPDFNEVVGISFAYSNKDLTDRIMKEMKSKNYVYKNIKEDGEIIYSNGKNELGFKSETSSTGFNEYHVSITKANLKL